VFLRDRNTNQKGQGTIKGEEKTYLQPKLSERTRAQATNYTHNHEGQWEKEVVGKRNHNSRITMHSETSETFMFSRIDSAFLGNRQGNYETSALAQLENTVHSNSAESSSRRGPT
jgi:hypothetical protein